MYVYACVCLYICIAIIIIHVCVCVSVCMRTCVGTCVHAYMVLLLSIGVLLRFKPVKLPDNVWVVQNEKLLHG